MEKPNDDATVVKSVCQPCHSNCGVLVHVKGGRVIKIEGDPDFPENEGSMCVRGLSFTQLLYHPDRIKYPMKRVGQRGEGKWQRISWDEALDTIASKIKQAKELRKWDIKPNKVYFEQLARVSVNQIIWGANYCPECLIHSRGWVVWDKMTSDKFSFAQAELAYTLDGSSLSKHTKTKNCENELLW